MKVSHRAVGNVFANGCQWLRIRRLAAHGQNTDIPRPAHAPRQSSPTAANTAGRLTVYLSPQYPNPIMLFLDQLNKPGMWLTTIEHTVSIFTL